MKKETVKLEVKNLNSFIEKCIGLMGKNKPENIYFETRWGIHTFFMKFPIDVVVMNNNNEIVVLFKKLKPRRIVVWNPKFKRVLELKPGTIERLRLAKKTKVQLAQ